MAHRTAADGQGMAVHVAQAVHSKQYMPATHCSKGRQRNTRADLGEELVQLLGPVLEPLGLELGLLFAHLGGEGAPDPTWSAAKGQARPLLPCDDPGPHSPAACRPPAALAGCLPAARGAPAGAQARSRRGERLPCRTQSPPRLHRMEEAVRLDGRSPRRIWLRPPSSGFQSERGL